MKYIGEACGLARKYFRMVGLEIYPVNTEEYAYLHECGADYVTVFRKPIIGISMKPFTLWDIKEYGHIVLTLRKGLLKAE